MKKMLKNNKGFTLVEIIIAITLIGLVATMAGSLINFSFKSEKKIESEYEIQSEVRLATEVINNAIRNTSVTFLMNGKMPATKATAWNYIGLSGDGSNIVQYTWNDTLKKHDEKILLKAKNERKYNLVFGNKEKTKLIDYTIGVQPQNGAKFDVSSSLNAANSLAVDYVKDNKTPASVLAYRLDERPKAGKDTKGTIVISMALDDSGSMAYRMSDKDSSSRNSVLKTEANKLIESFPENVNLGIFSFSDTANDASVKFASGSHFIKLVDTTAKEAAKKKIPTKTSGGTNIGDALRRSYYQLKGYQPQNNEEPIYYTILLTDGDPTYFSHTATVKWWGVAKSEYENSIYNGKIPKEKYQTENGNPIWVTGPGNQDDAGGNCLNYAKVVGEMMANDNALKIKTFVIGFSSDPKNAKTIAKSANVLGTNEKDIYFDAKDSKGLEIAFDTIREAILTEYWHIYGPYGKPND